MVTYPSTYGVFEEGIKEICQITHDNGGLVRSRWAAPGTCFGLGSWRRCSWRSVAEAAWMQPRACGIRPRRLCLEPSVADGVAVVWRCSLLRHNPRTSSLPLMCTSDGGSCHSVRASITARPSNECLRSQDRHQSWISSPCPMHPGILRSIPDHLGEGAWVQCSLRHAGS